MLINRKIEARFLWVLGNQEKNWIDAMSNNQLLQFLKNWLAIM